MALKEDRYEDNSPGAYYVDIECIACDTCTMVAKTFFKLTEDCDHAYVMKQPKTTQDIMLCEQALEACPVHAIGNDG